MASDSTNAMIMWTGRVQNFLQHHDRSRMPWLCLFRQNVVEDAPREMPAGECPLVGFASVGVQNDQVLALDSQ